MEYHIRNFIWGGLQRTDQEIPYPYGIYGTPNYFINRNPELKATHEMDRTAFESSFALAEYALRNPMEADDSLWYDNNYKVWYSHPEVNDKSTWDFMHRQFYANLSCRGVLEAEWNTLGSDFFGSSDHSEHSYMARMGGYGVLNYALRYDKNPRRWLSLGYASYLNPYGVMNVGDEESDYGYWYPGKEKNGAIGQAYTSEKFGKPWIGTEETGVHGDSVAKEI